VCVRICACRCVCGWMSKEARRGEGKEGGKGREVEQTSRIRPRAAETSKSTAEERKNSCVHTRMNVRRYGQNAWTKTQNIFEPQLLVPNWHVVSSSVALSCSMRARKAMDSWDEQFALADSECSPVVESSPFSPTIHLYQLQ